MEGFLGCWSGNQWEEKKKVVLVSRKTKKQWTFGPRKGANVAWRLSQTEYTIQRRGAGASGERAILLVKQIGQGFAEQGLCCEQVFKVIHYGHIMMVGNIWSHVQPDNSTAVGYDKETATTKKHCWPRIRCDGGKKD